ncbi:MAG: penicillin-insensitive murein endopeptidase, partial [Bdellovibrionaceae bacterium]|nr:penicillin-insensitive murein endopeptidase [Pseudobdellovibrionaceae bacterium]
IPETVETPLVQNKDDEEEFSEDSHGEDEIDVSGRDGRYVGFVDQVDALFRLQTPKEWAQSAVSATQAPPPTQSPTVIQSPAPAQPPAPTQPPTPQPPPAAATNVIPDRVQEPSAPSLSAPSSPTATQTPSPSEPLTLPETIFRPQAIGCYAAKIQDPKNPRKPCLGGSLMNAASLDLQAPHYQVLKPQDKAYFGTDLMILFVDRLAKAIRALLPEYRLQVGDIAVQNGGKFGPHRSHHNGLDGDFGYLVKRPNSSSFVKVVTQQGALDTRKILLHEQWLIFKKVVATGHTSRILVNKAIKTGFCAHAKNTGEFESEKETLRRLYKVSGHIKHWHLRLKCPQDPANARCRDELAPPDKHDC